MLIGLYRSQDPLKSLPKDRLYALANEALKQGVELVFFHTANVNFHNEMINGKIYDGEKWIQKRVPFPRVMINEWPNIPKNRTTREKKLRKKIHCTTYLIEGKLGIYNHLKKSKKFRKLTIPSKEIESMDGLFNYIENNQEVVVKPVGGRRGQNIYYISKKAESYVMKDHNKTNEYSSEELTMILEEKIKSKRYIMQPYINSTTRQGEPFDFRVHVQRNGAGVWEVTKTYPRIGNKKSILSNISRGGRTEEVKVFLEKEFGGDPESLLSELENAALGIAAYIDAQYKFTIDELGVDLTIDQQGNMYLYEVNTGPQTRYHENERAIKTIAYAKYLTEKLTPVKNEQRLKIGMLTGIAKGTTLKRACQHAANSEGVDFFFFTPKGINPDGKTIDGYYYVGDRRVARRFNYPDAIYDRLRMKNTKRHKKTYDALKGIPLTNNRRAGSVSKEVMYEKIEEQDRFNDHLIPYESIGSFNKLEEFIDKHQRVIIKSNGGSYGSNVYQVIKDNSNYVLMEKKKKKVFTKEEFKEIYTKRWKKYYIVQKYIHSYTKREEPFDIRVHLVKGGDKKWHIAEKYARVGSSESFTSNLALGGYVRKFEDFLIDNFNQKVHSKLRASIDKLSYDFSLHFNELYTTRIDEIGLDIGIDESLNLWLFEVNINRPGTTFHEYEVAKLAIPYAVALAKESLNKK